MFITICIMLFFVLSAVLTNCSNYLEYKKVYKTLPNLIWRVYENHLYGFKYEEDISYCDNTFIYFIDRKIPGVPGNWYFSNAFFIYLDPYAMYWRRKYLKFFDNLDLTQIQKL